MEMIDEGTKFMKGTHHALQNQTFMALLSRRRLTIAPQGLRKQIYSRSATNVLPVPSAVDGGLNLNGEGCETEGHLVVKFLQKYDAADNRQTSS